MNSLNFGYSLKNIPKSTNKDYLIRIINMTEKFLIRARWKAFFKPTTKDTFGFKSSKPTSHIKELDHFETEIL